MRYIKIYFYGDNREHWKPHIEETRKEIEDAGHVVTGIVETHPDPFRINHTMYVVTVYYE